jgi:hypothetical protein
MSVCEGELRDSNQIGVVAPINHGGAMDYSHTARDSLYACGGRGEEGGGGLCEEILQYVEV